MVIFLNSYFLSTNLFSLLFLFFTFGLFHFMPVVSMNDYNTSNNFFGLSLGDYYDLYDYLEESHLLVEQLDQEITTITTIDNGQGNTLHSTFNNYEKPAQVSRITTMSTNYLSENNSKDDDNSNFIAAGDWACNKETKKTIKKITKLDPELVLGLGDYTFESISPQCWFDISKPIDDKLKIAIGNHDLDYQISYYQLLNHYNLQEPYYSFDFQNIHFLAISSEHSFEEGSKQYKFIKKDLEESLPDSSILWRIVFLHKPMYTSADFDRKYSEELKNTFHQLFEKYSVDFSDIKKWKKFINF